MSKTYQVQFSFHDYNHLVVFADLLRTLPTAIIKNVDIEVSASFRIAFATMEKGQVATLHYVHFRLELEDTVNPFLWLEQNLPDYEANWVSEEWSQS